MKILFLHLSDAHLRENTNLSQINTSAIIRSSETHFNGSGTNRRFPGRMTKATKQSGNGRRENADCDRGR